MLISPKVYKESLCDKTYGQLIKERTILIKEIKRFENGIDEKEMLKKPSAEVIYQYNLLYLAKICEEISERCVNEDIWNIGQCRNDINWIFILKNLMDQSMIEKSLDKIKARQSGKQFTFSEHVEGLIYSLLSNQRQWNRIDENLDKIEAIFFDFNIDKIKNTNPDYFIKALKKIKCGNRDIEKQMLTLPENITTMEEIETEYGSLDEFITSKPAHMIVKEISDSSSNYKFQRIGEALAWEYLRNVGIDGCKPDVHVRRFFGSGRMGYSKKQMADTEEVYHIVEKISDRTGLSKMEIDALIWNFCSVGNSEICCAVPKCHVCPIKEYCLRVV